MSLKLGVIVLDGFGLTVLYEVCLLTLVCLFRDLLSCPHGSQGFICCPLSAGAERDAGVRAVQLHGADRGSVCGWMDNLPSSS